ncbi:beta-fructofuranosidase, insoluble isoenzyme CWINV1 [Artemisia annua]|uniref:Beta-fructofuranosidase, insoluble isoenzyme CWINV1 n=1 Tax=Artemisia annua TaxID=35608 RepID=A0A2U1PBU8_ARTAN|nr:beta-fructofuranosidase, insoluble isoenzyme CWINV1 [Artemisia annua]
MCLPEIFCKFFLEVALDILKAYLKLGNDGSVLQVMGSIAFIIDDNLSIFHAVLGHHHEINSSQHIKNLLNKPGSIFGGDSDESSADENATTNSDSSTRTPSGGSKSKGMTMADLLRSSSRFKKAKVSRMDTHSMCHGTQFYLDWRQDDNKKLEGGSLHEVVGITASQIDHSIVESFGGGWKTCITARVYPTLAVGNEAVLFAFNNGT